MLDSTLATLLCSRLCHDLVSPVGAIVNGLEILESESESEFQRQVFDLLSNSAGETSNRLKFFRLAFGMAGEFDEEIDSEELEVALCGYFSASKINVVWKINKCMIARARAKYFLNAALILGESIIREGVIEVIYDPDTESSMIRAEAERLNFDENARKALLGEIEIDEVTARYSPAYLARLLAEEADLVLSLNDASEDAIILSAKPIS